MMLQCPQMLGRPFSRLCLRMTFLPIVLFVSLARSCQRPSCRILERPIENEGLQAEVIDIIQVPACAIACPLARINELKQVPDLPESEAPSFR